jgi:hypothetical protein
MLMAAVFAIIGSGDPAFARSDKACGRWQGMSLMMMVISVVIWLMFIAQHLRWV